MRTTIVLCILLIMPASIIAENMGIGQNTVASDQEMVSIGERLFPDWKSKNEKESASPLFFIGVAGALSGLALIIFADDISGCDFDCSENEYSRTSAIVTMGATISISGLALTYYSIIKKMSGD